MSFIFTVQPFIRAQSTIVHSYRGKSIYLRCSAHVPFDGKFFWSRYDNRSLVNQTRKFRQYHTYADVIQTSLVIRNVESTDFGIYTCRTESIAGHSEATIHLKGNCFVNNEMCDMSLK
jgi:hypothetical protein